MGWLRVDDAFTDHPKIAGLSDRAFRAHVEGLVYCARYLTDGQIPRAKAPSARVTGELERAGLWSSTKRGFVIHDFLDYNPSKAETLDKRAAKSMAGAKGAAARWHGGVEWQTDAPPSHSTLDAPVPVPLPLPQEQKKPSTTRTRDVIADALARAENAEPLEVPASHMRTLCVKANELRKVAPDVTPEEVARRAANWSSHMRDATISGPAIVTHWGRLGSPALNGGPRDRAADILRGAAAKGGSRGSLPG